MIIAQILHHSTAAVAGVENMDLLSSSQQTDHCDLILIVVIFVDVEVGQK